MKEYNRIKIKEGRKKKMKLIQTGKELMDDVIKRFGFEDNRTVYFCTMVEGYWKGVLTFDFVVNEYARLMNE